MPAVLLDLACATLWRPALTLRAAAGLAAALGLGWLITSFRWASPLAVVPIAALIPEQIGLAAACLEALAAPSERPIPSVDSSSRKA